MDGRLVGVRLVMCSILVSTTANLISRGQGLVYNAKSNHRVSTDG
jgi:hypothetical protein